MSKKIQIEITANGEVRAKTLGIKGEACLNYVELIEELVDAETIDSAFTEEYQETAIHSYSQQQHHLKKE
ncbi:DUF2997 domain-containing protein [Amphibacillus jilinensis]|uniref:DUF2997 domain-containing protein n=1 Tax=Amphibacillus jilinensis TaxID=1216008 RepID=UPI0002F676F9|nr:DUF2997 domain-containing protein [Amphibacillus jilinensis]